VASTEPRSGENADWPCRFSPSSRRETRPRTTRIESATSIDWNSVGLAHEHDGHFAVEVLDRDHAVGVAALLRDAVLHARDEPRHRDDVAVGDVLVGEKVVDDDACVASGISSPASGWTTYSPASRARRRACPSWSTPDARHLRGHRLLGGVVQLSKSKPIAPLSLVALAVHGRFDGVLVDLRGGPPVSPIESNAPALMSDSTVRLLATCSGHVSRKWWKDVYGHPRAPDDAVDDVRDVADGASPKRMSSPTAAK
jgi:hypothetical protein